MMRAGLAVAAAACGLALAPATAGAALITFGSTLGAPANAAEARGADTIYFQSAFADASATTVPASGQITSVRLKGYAPNPPVPGQPGGETLIHFQTLKPLGGGGYQVLVTTGAFDVPNAGGPETVTSYAPVNFCAAAGDVVVVNTIGGFGVPLFPQGTPLQIFSSVPNAVVSEYTADNGTNNGAIVSPKPLAGRELLMQMTVGTGPDGTGLCPGGGGTAPPPPPPPGPPPPPPPPPPGSTRIQKATISPQRVTVSRLGKLTVSLFCRTGPGRCTGTLRVRSRARTPTTLGSAPFNIVSARTGRVTLRLNMAGRRRFHTARGRLPVNLVAETRPGGPSRRSTLAVTLRRRGS